jgi:acetoin utilization deacetylase AcuC-like enzyme
MEKYRLLYERIIREGLAKPGDILEPKSASDEEICLVHTKDYIHKLKTGTLSREEEMKLELPYSRELVEASWLGAGGSILSAKTALKEGWGMNLAGGFHHAFADHGEGFCVLNDIAIAIKVLFRERKIRKAAVIDLDLHQGNGTVDIFKNDEAVFTFSMHQENNYPFYKPPSDLDIGLPDGTGDERYLEILHRNLKKILDGFKPDFMVYLAGADPYRYDQLGGLTLSLKGLKSRDEEVIRNAKEKGIAISVVLGGGYAFKVEDTVEIHFNTAKKLIKDFS